MADLKRSDKDKLNGHLNGIRKLGRKEDMERGKRGREGEGEECRMRGRRKKESNTEDHLHLSNKKKGFI